MTIDKKFIRFLKSLNGYPLLKTWMITKKPPICWGLSVYHDMMMYVARIKHLKYISIGELNKILNTMHRNEAEVFQKRLSQFIGKPFFVNQQLLKINSVSLGPPSKFSIFQYDENGEKKVHEVCLNSVHVDMTSLKITQSQRCYVNSFEQRIFWNTQKKAIMAMFALENMLSGETEEHIERFLEENHATHNKSARKKLKEFFG